MSKQVKHIEATLCEPNREHHKQFYYVSYLVALPQEQSIQEYHGSHLAYNINTERKLITQY